MEVSCDCQQLDFAVALSRLDQRELPKMPVIALFGSSTSLLARLRRSVTYLEESSRHAQVVRRATATPAPLDVLIRTGTRGMYSCCSSSSMKCTCAEIFLPQTILNSFRWSTQLFFRENSPRESGVRSGIPANFPVFGRRQDLISSIEDVQTASFANYF